MNESSLSVRQLMERYGTSKPTIHQKLKHKDILPYVKIQNNVTYLDVDGLNIFNDLMVNSKVATRKVNEKKDDSLPQVNDLAGDIFNNPYVDALKKQIESFQQEKESWRQERETYLKSIKTMTENFKEFQRLLPAPQPITERKGLLIRIKKLLE